MDVILKEGIDQVNDRLDEVVETGAKQSSFAEVLDILKYNGVKILNVTANTATQNPISVTGKGKLYYFCFQATHQKSIASRLSLTIDGKEVMTFNNAYSGGTGYLYLFLNNLVMCYSADNNACYYLYGVQPVSHRPVDNYNYMDGGELTKEASVIYSRDNSSAGIVCYTPYCVEFENGFSVSASGCRADAGAFSNYYVCYSLDE